MDENKNLKKLVLKFSNATFVVYLRMLEEPNRVWCSRDFFGMCPEATIFRALKNLIAWEFVERLEHKRGACSAKGTCSSRGGPNFFQYRLKDVKF